jgi:hypothetical protein
MFRPREKLSKQISKKLVVTLWNIKTMVFETPKIQDCVLKVLIQWNSTL